MDADDTKLQRNISTATEFSKQRSMTALSDKLDENKIESNPKQIKTMKKNDITSEENTKINDDQNELKSFTKKPVQFKGDPFKTQKPNLENGNVDKVVQKSLSDNSNSLVLWILNYT